MLAVPQTVTHQSEEAKTTDSWNKKKRSGSVTKPTLRDATESQLLTPVWAGPQCDKRFHLNLCISIPRALILAF